MKNVNLKSHLNLIFLIGMGLFVACTKGDVNPNDGPVIPDVPVVFSSGLSDWSGSRVANGSWDKGDSLGIYMIPHVAEASAAADFFSAYAETASNVPYLTSGNGESVALAVGNDVIVFPVDGSQVNFVAYSPYKVGVNTTNGHIYKVDVSTQSPAKAIDLLYHKGTGMAYSKNKTNVTLGFTHQLSKLKISLVPASGTEADLTDATLTLTGFSATADFNLSTGVLNNLGGTDKSITPVKDAASSAGRADFEAILVPHAGNSYTRNVIFKINDTDYPCPLPASAVFKAGAVHSYNFKFTGTKVKPEQKMVDFGDGGTVSWGDYQLTTGKLSLDLPATRTTGNIVTLSTNAPLAPTYTLSGEAETNTDDKPEWMTGVSLSDPTPGEGGWNSYTLTFDTEYNINSEAALRTGYIRLEVADITLPVRVNQKADGYDVCEPEPASFADLVVGGKTGNSFTLATNVQDKSITVTTTNTSLITNLTKTRSEVAADGTSTWTIGFDVAANTTTDARTGDVEVILGGIKKTVTVSQAGISVHDPLPASFDNLAVGGLAGNTFTIETNARNKSITATTKASWIKILTKTRSEMEADGASTWTIGFDVTANATTNVRSGNIEVTIGGITKTVSVSQAGVSVGEPSQTSFPDLAVGGETGKTFTIETNAPDESITVNGPAWMTKQTPSRSIGTTDGSYIWTIGFDVPANTTTSARTGNIEVTIGGIKKTIPVSQVAMYVNAPSTPKIENVIAAGVTDKTFTIETNSTAIVPTSLTTTDESMITNLTSSRAVAADGSSTWTIGFDVSANTTTSVRKASISINIGGITNTVSVSQVAMPMYVKEPSTASFNVAVGGTTDNLFTIETNDPDESIMVNRPAWITNLTKTRSEVAANGSFTWTIGFDVSANKTASDRTGNIEVTIGEIKKTVTVSQVGMYVNEPSPASIDVVAAGATGKTFTIETNAPDESITVTCPAWITKQVPSHSAVAGSSTWTIGFDVSANTTASARSASVSINIGGITKTVSVSQAGVPVYVNAPNPASIENVIAVGETDKTFTITTNAPDNDITTTNPSWITSLTKSRSAVAEADGSSTWTIGFNVSANITTSTRTGNIEVTIGGITKTVSVSQAVMYVGEPSTAKIENVIAAGVTDKTFTIETNSTAIVPTSLTTTDESMITNLTSSRAVAADGSSTWTIGFDVSANTTTSVRTASISINIGGITNTVSVSQVAMPMYVKEPSTASFNVAVGGTTDNLFTIETNDPDESIMVTTTNTSMITNLTSRSVAANGSSTWTIGFDVPANTTADARTGNIEVTIGGIKKTVTVSQIAMYVNAPNPANIPNVNAAGEMGKTFTIETNAPDEEITPTTNAAWITDLVPDRSVKDATNGIYLWTVTFDVSANTTTSVRKASISINIGGITKTVNVSQAGVYVNTPNPTSFAGLPVGGATGRTFTIETNASDENITVRCPAWITKQDPSRSAVAADGSSTWTIPFDVSANTTADARTGNIEVTIGGITKTVNVSQAGVYVNTPNPTSFAGLPVGGATGKTFTIETNSTDTVLTSLTPADGSMITILKPDRSLKDATNGIYLWTVTFNVSANTTDTIRTGSIEVKIGEVTKTVSVSQVALYINAPIPVDVQKVGIAGEMGKTFIAITNAPNEITVRAIDDGATNTETSWITNLTPLRNAVAADGTSTWIIRFDVAANTGINSRSAFIKITTGDIWRLVSVMQDGSQNP